METAQAQKLIHGEPPGFNRNYRKRPKEETEDHSTKILFFHTKWEVNIMNYRTVTFFFPFPLWLILKSSDHIRTVNSLI